MIIFSTNKEILSIISLYNNQTVELTIDTNVNVKFPSWINYPN